jgi:hypothetical protein
MLFHAKTVKKKFFMQKGGKSGKKSFSCKKGKNSFSSKRTKNIFNIKGGKRIKKSCFMHRKFENQVKLIHTIFCRYTNSIAGLALSDKRHNPFLSGV